MVSHAVVQSVALSIPLKAKPQEVFNVLWTGMDGKQAVALVRADKMLRLEQYDLTNGQKLGSMDTLFEVATYVRDFSPDGNEYVCNHPGTPYSIWAMPNPKAIVDKWLPPPVQNESMGVANTAVAAYLLNGPLAKKLQRFGKKSALMVDRGWGGGLYHKVVERALRLDLAHWPPLLLFSRPVGREALTAFGAAGWATTRTLARGDFGTYGFG